MVFAAHDGHDSHTLYSSHWFRIHQGTRTMKRSQCCSRSFSASGSSPWSSIFAIDSAIASYLWRNNTITNNNTTTTTLSGNYKEWPQRKPMPMPCFEQTWYNTVIPYHIISSKTSKSNLPFFSRSLAPGHHIHGEVFLLQWSLFSILRLQSPGGQWEASRKLNKGNYWKITAL